MTKKSFKPVKLFFTSEGYKEIFDSIRQAFDIISKEAELDRRIHVEMSDISNYQVSGKLKISNYSHMDQMFEDCTIKPRGKVDSSKLFGVFLNLLINSVGNDYLDNYYLVITQKYDLKTEDTNFIIGGGWPGFGAIISILRITGKSLPKEKIPKNISIHNFDKEMVITEILHEFGHVFGCAREGRKYTTDSLGSHDDPKFIDNCVMIQGLRVPDDWIEMTKKRLRSKYAFCELCREELKEYFSN